MFKIKRIQKEEGLLNDITFHAPNSVDKGDYILKHVKGEFYKTFSLKYPEKIDINDGRGTWKEKDILEKFNTKDWIIFKIKT